MLRLLLLIMLKMILSVPKDTSSAMWLVKKAILVDDILNTGRTFSQASKIVQEGGATEIYAVASHGLFAGTAAQLLDEAPIKEILVTDSVSSKEQHPKNIAFLTASDLIANAIHRIQEHQPLSPLFKFTNPIKEN